MMREREEGITWVMKYCQHYDANGIVMIGGKEPTGVCKAGVNFKETFGTETGIFQRIPCTSGGKKSQEQLLEMCPKWLQTTREQGEEREDSMEAMVRQMTLVSPVVKAWRSWTKQNRVGKEEVIQCPVCQGKLHLSQAAYNGHVWGKCETADCVSWME